MKGLLGFVLISFLFCSVTFGLDVPGYTGYLNDYADLLSKSERQKLESRLVEYEKLTSNEIAILIVESLDGENLEEFSIRVADSWKPGKADKDNGVILLISEEDKKIRLEVGDGLTGRLTDLLSGRVIDGEISPKFKNGDFYEGIDNGVSMIIKVVEGEFTMEDYEHEQKVEAFFLVGLVFAIIAVLAGALSSVAGGAVGGILGSILGTIFFELFGLAGIIISAIVMIIIGIIGGIILRAMAEGSGGYGGGYSGGGGGSFSFGGGGFSGGGASGGW
jgi:uncharacterized protein